MSINSGLKMPLVIEDKVRCDVRIFFSVESALQSMEPESVKNHEYRVYDANGRHITLRASKKMRKMFFGLIGIQSDEIEIDDISEEINQKELQGILIHYISRHNTESQDVENLSVDQLIRMAAKIPKQIKGRW